MTSKTAISNFVEIGKKIVAVGRNFSEHAAELGNAVPTEPVLFFKPTSSYIVQGQPIKLPPGATELHHEVELGLVIGKDGADIPASSAMDHVAGYTLALDMTDRAKQTQLKSKGLPWSLAKGFDTSCPVSEFITKDKIPDINNLELWLKVNGDLRQEGNTNNMIFKVPFLISYISQYFKLERGDLILTGTPQGVGPVVPGDIIECGLKDIVSMKFNVEARR